MPCILVLSKLLFYLPTDAQMNKNNFGMITTISLHQNRTEQSNLCLGKENREVRAQVM
jgi:hypothetical protein